MIRQLKSYLLERAESWDLPVNGEWRHLFFNNYHPNGSDIDILWFYNRERYPRVVSKLSRDASRLEHEFGNLMRIYSSAPNIAPEPLYFGEQGTFWSIWMRGVSGVRFSGRYSLGVLSSIVDTVISLHDAVRSCGATAGPDRHKKAVMDPITFLAEFGTSQSVVEGCRRVAAAADPAWLAGVPVIPQHGDLYMGNLLADGNRWALVDWENFDSIDLPACDLYTLLLSVLRLNGAESAQWKNEHTSHVAGLVKRYAGRFVLRPVDMQILLPLSLANWAYLQWGAGRAEFLKTFYPTVADYFVRTSSWEKVFCGC